MDRWNAKVGHKLFHTSHSPAKLDICNCRAVKIFPLGSMGICIGIDRANLQECAIGVSPFSFLNELYFLYCAGIKPSLVTTAPLVKFLASPLSIC